MSNAAPLSAPILSRAQTLQNLSQDEFDVVVIGGGVTGLGVAVDAASRGLRVALLERHDFSSGTSSKSSKLIHGGLRYLQQGDVRLVYEALHERRRLRSNAPHLVQVLPFMIPIVTKDGLIKKKIARALGSALWMYDLTGGWRIGKFHRRLNAKAAYKHLPTMPKDRLASAYLYYDAAADDSRICIALAQTAAQQGATLANWCSVTGIEKDASENFLVRAQSQEGNALTVKAKAVVNASGVWADDVRKLDEGKHPSSIRPAKGVHITVPWSLVRNDIAVVIPVPKDKRSLFVVPWVPNDDGTFQYTYIGTTDTGYDGPADNPQCTKDDIDYVLRALNASITNEVTHKDVLAVWAGLRPLVKPDENEKIGERTADLSRRHRVSTSTSGVITVTGGKLTTYREMSEDTIDAVIGQLHLSHRKYRCRTKNLALHGARGYRESKSRTAPQQHLAHRFGSYTTDIEALIAAQPDLALPLIDGLPYLRAEAMYAVTHEMAYTLDDVLSRRTRALLFNRTATKNAARSVAELIAPLLQWNESDINNQVAHFNGICADEEAAGLVTESEFLASTKEQP
ncbi:MAG: glycerol-3-phosphate dehydrogenase/oxidase [Actinomycetes bacterium]